MMMNLYDPWVIHCTVWGDGAEAVLRYLARYVFRVAITEGRIVRLDDDAVNQVLISSHRKLLSSKAMVVNVAEKPERDSTCEGLGVKFPVAAGKAANLEGERPLPSIARFRTASISDARGGNKPRCART